ncbi:nucleotide sugar dehydrogenase [Vibrio sp. TRT 17S01]|uniref:nucleotide sugar dehydrogenase n=1 Tax=Vibrio sp. TRT 17S01 TaxID=3418505 RepID=UPI003CF37663
MLTLEILALLLERNIKFQIGEIMESIYNKKVAVIGLGYVGLPLAVEFGKEYSTIGFDINKLRVAELKESVDNTLECTTDEINSSKHLSFTSDLKDLAESNIYIVTVPTPIDKHKQPDLSPLINASKMISSVICKGDIVIYESTVYPGATEEVCVPVIEEISGLSFNEDFFVGYSPERINPGDKVNRLINIKKVTSGSDAKTAAIVDDLYSSIIKAGTFKASSIKIAEASKIIENTQRDVNIALMNEFSMIFDKLGIDTKEVIEAASTKWNFIKLTPGLVGGHCIGVDPYYLVHKSESVGHIPDIMKSARQINDSMASYKASSFVKKMILNKIDVSNSKVLVLGITFKPDCPDIRNTKIVDLVSEFESYGIDVSVYDPHANAAEVMNEYSVALVDEDSLSQSFDVIIQAVNHSEFLEYNFQKSSSLYLSI